MHSRQHSKRRIGEFAIAFLVVLALPLSACGGDSAGGAGQTQTRVTEVKGVRAQPAIHVPAGPPPDDLVVKVLDEGVGVAAHVGQHLQVQYIGVNYHTKRQFENVWGTGLPFEFTLGAGEVRKGWEIGLRGMKVGGRRELILPSRLAYGTGPLLYVVELISVEDVPKRL